MAISSFSGLAARATAILAQLISVPLALSYLGSERYGIWLVLSSFLAILALADLGLGNGLVNAISEAEGQGDRRLATEAVSSAFFALTGLAVVAAIVFYLAQPVIPWTELLNVRSTRAVEETRPTIAVFFGCFLVGVPLSVALRVHMGVQESYVSNLWQAAGILFGLIGLVAAIQLGLSLPWIVLSLAGGPALASGLSSAHLFWRRRPWLRPRPRNATLPSTRRIVGLGMWFFAVQMAGAVSYQSDSLIIARLLGAEHVPEYGVPLKLFTLAPITLSLILMPLWPAYREALSRGDSLWVRRTLPRSFALSLLLVAPPSAALMMFGAPIIRLWVGTAISPAPALLIGLGLWAITMSLSGPLAMYLNAAGIIRFQALAASTMAVANISLSIFLVRRIGVVGAVYGSLITQVVFILLPSLVYARRHLQTLAAPKDHLQ